MPKEIITCITTIEAIKKDPLEVVERAKNGAVAVFNQDGNEPVFYCVPSKVFEDLLEAIDDQELLKIARHRLAKGDFIEVDTV